MQVISGIGKSIEGFIHLLVTVGLLKEVQGQGGKSIHANPIIKSGARKMGLGKGETAIFEALIALLKRADGVTPSRRKQAILRAWLAKLEAWQRIGLMLTFAKMVDQFGGSDKPLETPLAALSMLADMGGEDADHKRRTAYCIQEGYFTEEAPAWYTTREWLQDVPGKIKAFFSEESSRPATQAALNDLEQANDFLEQQQAKLRAARERIENQRRNR